MHGRKRLVTSALVTIHASPQAVLGLSCCLGIETIATPQIAVVPLRRTIQQSAQVNMGWFPTAFRPAHRSCQKKWQRSAWQAPCASEHMLGRLCTCLCTVFGDNFARLTATQI